MISTKSRSPSLLELSVWADAELQAVFLKCFVQSSHFFFPQGIFHFQLGRGEPMLHTRLRPHCKEFLEKIAKLYELHVFTFGSRLYAHTIAGNSYFTAFSTWSLL